MTDLLRNVRPTWIAFGWFIAAAVTSLVLLALIAFEFVPEQDAGEDIWTAFAFLVGFFTGGFLVGARVGTAPVLHGVAIGLFSLLVWFAVNLFLGEPTGQTAWRSLPLSTTTMLIVLQTASAAIGARTGVRWAMARG